MQRFVSILSAVSVLSALSGFATPAFAHSTYGECVAEAMAASGKNTAQLELMVAECDRLYSKNKGLDKLAKSMPRDERPGRLPNPDGRLTAAGVGEQVDSPRDCDSGVATYDDDTKKWTCQPGTVQGVAGTVLLSKVQPAQGCRWVGKVIICPPNSPTQTIEIAIDEPTTTDQKLDEIYPGLPPAPPAPQSTGKLFASEFTPTPGSGTYQGGNGGSPNQGSGAARLYQSLFFLT